MLSGYMPSQDVTARESDIVASVLYLLHLIYKYMISLSYIFTTYVFVSFKENELLKGRSRLYSTLYPGNKGAGWKETSVFTHLLQMVVHLSVNRHRNLKARIIIFIFKMKTKNPSHTVRKGQIYEFNSKPSVNVSHVTMKINICSSYNPAKPIYIVRHQIHWLELLSTLLVQS